MKSKPVKSAIQHNGINRIIAHETVMSSPDSFGRIFYSAQTAACLLVDRKKRARNAALEERI
jgi:hypothetical protein